MLRYQVLVGQVGDRRRLVGPQPAPVGQRESSGAACVELDWVKIDYLYGANWSIWLDLKILLRTVSYVIARRGV